MPAFIRSMPGRCRTPGNIEPLAMLMMELGYSQRMGSAIALRLMNPTGATELVKSADVLDTELRTDLCGR